MPGPQTSRRSRLAAAGFAPAGAILLAMPGCGIVVPLVQAVPGLVAVAGDTYERTGSREVLAEYRGLEGHDYAVIVSADPIIRMNHPSAVDVITNAMARALTEEAVGATGLVPGPRVLEYQYANPRWTAMTYAEIAEEFTVERLVVLDLHEYRLHEPGNRYTWDGRISMQIGVVEADSSAPDDFAFVREVRISYPDSPHAVQELSAEHVESVLQVRAIQRASWLFYDHEEPNIMRY